MKLRDFITEGINENTKDIDRVSTLEMVRLINNEDKKIAFAVEKELENISKAIDEITERIKNGGRLIYIGSGTSGRLGILDASECPPTFGVRSELVKGLISGGHDAICEAIEGVEDYRELGRKDLIGIDFNGKDVVVGISSSGRTPYVIGALEYANEIGAFTISLTSNPGSEMSKLSNISICPVVGPEVITGSTRMKSGTSHKMVLNMLSTGTMIKLGKVYGNLMVDVQINNMKLYQRAQNLIMKAANVTEEEAEKYLEKSGNNVKLAILMIKTGLDKDSGEKLLNKHQGYLAKALDEFKK